MSRQNRTLIGQHETNGGDRSLGRWGQRSVVTMTPMSPALQTTRGINSRCLLSDRPWPRPLGAAVPRNTTRGICGLLQGVCVCNCGQESEQGAVSGAVCRCFVVATADDGPRNAMSFVGDRRIWAMSVGQVYRHPWIALCGENKGVSDNSVTG